MPSIMMEAVRTMALVLVAAAAAASSGGTERELAASLPLSSGGTERELAASLPLPPSFTVLENYTGSSFFDGFMFFSGAADPTEGYVRYVDHDTAFQTRLAAVTADGAVLLRVDNSSAILPPPPPRPTTDEGQQDHHRQLQPAPPPAAPCNTDNATRCERCPDLDFWGYDGDGCDLANHTASSGSECCDLCHAYGSRCTGYTLDQHVCYLKSIDYCTPRASPPPGVYHTCAGVMSERGQSCPGGPAAADARPSVRVSSRATFDVNTFGGADTLLVVADIQHVPTGCAVWPAFWMLGPTWPDDGEIDIIEGWNGQEFTESTLHTAPGCSQSSVPSSLFTGRRAKSAVDKQSNATDCFVHAPSQGANQGCGILGPPGSLGERFNSEGGGVFATLIRNPNPMAAATRRQQRRQTEEAAEEGGDDEAPLGRGEIAMWFWPRRRTAHQDDAAGEPGAGATSNTDSIPRDVTAGSPSPGSEGWGEPYGE